MSEFDKTSRKKKRALEKAQETGPHFHMLRDLIKTQFRKP